MLLYWIRIRILVTPDGAFRGNFDKPANCCGHRERCAGKTIVMVEPSPSKQYSLSQPLA